MENRLNWKLGGESGYGIITTGLVFAKACLRGGLFVVDNGEFPSLIKGGHNTYQVRVEPQPTLSPTKPLNLLVALNKEAIDRHARDLVPGGGIIYDPDSTKIDSTDDSIKLYPVPFLKTVRDLNLDKIMINQIALGASFGLVDYDFSILQKTIEDTFGGKKGAEVAADNVKAAKAGYDYCKTNHKDFYFKLHAQKPHDKLLVTGHEALALGALRGGMKFYSAYPMTPASNILHFMANKEHDYKLVVKQAEDEIAAMIMSLGAWHAGARAMVATSGGGFSLMVEGIGLAAMTETPAVIVLGQRGGPSTGLPTRTTQGDLRFGLHAGHDDFPKIVMMPGDASEAFYMTGEAFNLAELYQLPVIIMTDKYFAESHFTVDRFDQSRIAVKRGIMTDEEAAASVNYKRYKVTDSGVSPRAVPGQKGTIFTAISDEHNELGIQWEETDNRIQQMDKRMRKLTAASASIKQYFKFHGPEDSDLTFVGWGSSKGSILETMKLLDAEGIKTNFLQILYASPFPSKDVDAILNKSNLVVDVEQNHTAQMAGLIREKTGFLIDNKLLFYNGRPIYPEILKERTMELIKHG